MQNVVQRPRKCIAKKIEQCHKERVFETQLKEEFVEDCSSSAGNDHKDQNETCCGRVHSVRATERERESSAGFTC